MSEPTPPGPSGQPTPPGPAVPPPPPPPPAPWHPAPGLPQSSLPRFADPRWEPEPSKQLAGWALGTALVPCFWPLTQLTAIGLAIAVLVRARDGRRHGQGMAVAALVIAPLWLIGITALIVSGALEDSDRDRDSSSIFGDRDDLDRRDLDLGARRLAEGDCLDYPDLTDQDRGSDDLVTTASIVEKPCIEPHDFEVFEVQDLTGTTYAGDGRTRSRSEEICSKAFKPFVGIRYLRSGLDVSYIYPTKRSWGFGDRSVTCLVGRYDTKTSGSLAGSRL